MRGLWDEVTIEVCPPEQEGSVSPGSGRSSLLGRKDSLCKNPGAALVNKPDGALSLGPCLGRERKKILGLPEPDLICLRGGL